MFSKAIVLSDVFLELPHSAQALYYNLSMNADDDGFVGNPKSLVRLCGCKLDDLNILLEKKYILGFKSGVICIKHWKMNNYIQKDRYKSTTYQEELGRVIAPEICELQGILDDISATGCKVHYAFPVVINPEQVTYITPFSCKNSSVLT